VPRSRSDDFLEKKHEVWTLATKQTPFPPQKGGREDAGEMIIWGVMKEGKGGGSRNRRGGFTDQKKPGSVKKADGTSEEKKSRC